MRNCIQVCIAALFASSRHVPPRTRRASPKNNHILEQQSMKRFLQDLKILSSRSSKFQKLPETIASDAMSIDDWKDFWRKHPQYLDLYSTGAGVNTNSSGGCVSSSTTSNGSSPKSLPLKRLVSKVGPMKRSRMEKMIYLHPKLMYNILSSDLDGIKSIAEQISWDLELNALQKEKISNVSKLVTVYRGNIRSIIGCFRKVLQLDKACIARILTKAPRLMNYSYTKIALSIDFFREKGFSKEEFFIFVGISFQSALKSNNCAFLQQKPQ